VPSDKINELEEVLLKLDPLKVKLDQISYEIDKFAVKDPPAQLTSHLNDIEQCFDQPSVEDIYIALDRHNTDWARKTRALFKPCSPTSLKVVFEELRRGAKLNLKEALQMEYRMSQHFMANKDFFEGVRALLVDKDKNPSWTPNTLEEISDADVQKYFDHLGDQELVLE